MGQDIRSMTDAEIEKADLLPCPFCGEKLIIHDDHHGIWWAHRDEPGPCFLSTIQILDLEDVKGWNKRI